MHFYLLALVPASELKYPDTPRGEVPVCAPGRGSVESAVSELLELYDENREVDPYEEDCACIGGRAVGDANTGIDAALPMVFIREYYDSWLRQSGGRRSDELPSKVWGNMVDVYMGARRNLEQIHPFSGAPDPFCGYYVGAFWDREVASGSLPASAIGSSCEEGCGGTGIATTTRNPDGRWDWWEIGGRWTGAISGYDPSKDPRNLERCTHCGGTGDREGFVYYELADGKRIEWRRDDPSEPIPDGIIRKFANDHAERCNGCNSCHGTGKSMKFRFVPHDGDIIPVEELIRIFDDRMIPASVLTSDGWYDMESGGPPRPHDIPPDEMKDILEYRRSQFLDILNGHRDCCAVVVDCHT